MGVVRVIYLQRIEMTTREFNSVDNYELLDLLGEEYPYVATEVIHLPFSECNTC